MSVSISRHTEGSITYCEEFEANDDIIQGSEDGGNNSFLSGGHHLEASTPKIGLPPPQFFGKENSTRNTTQMRNRRKSTALDTIQLENQSVIRNGEKSATSQKRKGRKRATMSFEIYCPGDEGAQGNSFREFKTPIRESMPVSIGLPSPEYEPGTFLPGNDSFFQMNNSAASSEEQQTLQLSEIFPNADPEFLKSEVERMNAPLNEVIDSVLSQIENNEIPTRERNKKQSEINMKNFSVVQLLKLVPDPWTYFSNKERDCSGYTEHSLHYLKTKFRKFYNQTITDALTFHNDNLFLACKYLKKKNRGLKLRMTNRPMSECNACKPTTVNLQFQLEVSFIEHEEEVKNYVKAQKAGKRLRLKEAARLGLLAECECCYGECLLREDVATCSAGHTFCKECIARFIGTGLENGTGQSQCLGPCNNEYSLQILHDVLTPDLFSKLMTTMQMSDRADLAECPFCDHVMYLPPDVKVVTCLNIQCLKESCRVCKSSNHEPNKCEMVKDE